MKETKGITLIALIITIIVLLILAGVALATLTGEGSIIQNAENAVAQYNNSVEKEQILINNVDKYLENGEIDSSENVNTSTSSGKSTLLWEKEVEPAENTAINEETIQLENLDKYKYIFLSVHRWEDAVGEWITIDFTNTAVLIPIDIIKENTDTNYGPSSVFLLKYIAENNFKVMYLSYSEISMKLQIYGVE